ncbi:lysyl oxidase-like protein 2/3/4 [Fusarium oxysporum NRRL 32931]|uniref:Amine oxidase n=1 Tax=Fusarium oxysporum NRRL 32931 TaxID=660029 RepID=W9IBW4_FUSOX|nr:lysyl oxidase-like protein 2/3/4 [Fusarium oxysporum NRRL 32931]
MPRSKEGFQWTPSQNIYGLETDAVVPSTPNSQLRQTYDAIVIGAGFAGLIAARDLSLITGAKVLLLEARDRIGGRTWTASAMGEHFEVGGTWIHWNQPHVFSELHRYNLHTNIKTSNGTFAPEKIYYKTPDGTSKVISESELNDRVEPIAKAFFTIDGLNSHELMPYPHQPFYKSSPWLKYDHLSIQDRLNQIDGPEEDKALFETLVNTIGSDNSSEIAFVEPLRWYALGGHSVAGMFEVIQSYKLGPGGQTLFARSILNEYRGHVKFETVIDKIEQAPRGVTITAKDGAVYRTKSVICTIPLNCLQDIQFSPPLSPLRQEAIKRGHMNKAAKVHFKLRQPEKAWLSMATTSGDSPFVFAFSDHNGTGNNVDSGTYAIAFGINGRVIERESNDEIISSFQKYLRPEAEVESYVTHNWVDDPYSKGTWCSWGPGEMSKYLGELQKSHGRVFMASADWAEGWRGFIDGAIEQGAIAARAAHKVLADGGDITPRL